MSRVRSSAVDQETDEEQGKGQGGPEIGDRVDGVPEPQGRVSGGVLEGVPGFMGGDAQCRDGGAVVDVFRKPEDLFARIVMVRQVARGSFDRDVPGAPRLQDPVRRFGARQSRRRANPAEPRVGASDFRLGKEGQGQGRNDQEHRRIPEHFVFLLFYDSRIRGRIKRPGAGRSGRAGGNTGADRGNGALDDKIRYNAGGPC